MQSRCNRCNSAIHESQVLCDECLDASLPDSVVQFNLVYKCAVCGWLKDTPAHLVGCSEGRKEVTFD